jgi:preprotein translocase subunit SecD
MNEPERNNQPRAKVMKKNYRRFGFGVMCAVGVIAMRALVIYPAKPPATGAALSAISGQKRGGRTTATPAPTPKPPTPLPPDRVKLPPEPPLTWQLLLHVEAPGPDREAVVRQTVAIIKTRLGAFRVSRFEARPRGDRILIHLSDVPDRGRLKKIITAAGGLELVAVISPSSPEPVRTYKTKKAVVASLGGRVPANRRVLPYAEPDESTVSSQNVAASKKLTRWVVVESPAIVDVNEIRETFAVQGSAATNDYAVGFSLKPSGAEKLGNWTGANIDRYLGIVLNNEVKSIGAIKSQISDYGQITGGFTLDSATDIAQILNSGALPAPVEIVYEGASKPKKGSQ